MNKILSILAITAVVFLYGFSGAAAQQNAPAAAFRSISPEEAMRMLQQRDDIVFLDVRTPQERSRRYIPGSQLTAFTDIVAGKLSYPMDKPILLVCAVGGRSYVAGQVLARKGYKEVYNLSGGVKQWYMSGLPLAHDKP